MKSLSVTVVNSFIGSFPEHQPSGVQDHLQQLSGETKEGSIGLQICKEVLLWEVRKRGSGGRHGLREGAGK